MVLMAVLPHPVLLSSVWYTCMMFLPNTSIFLWYFVDHVYFSGYIVGYTTKIICSHKEKIESRISFLISLFNLFLCIIVFTFCLKDLFFEITLFWSLKGLPELCTRLLIDMYTELLL